MLRYSPRADYLGQEEGIIQQQRKKWLFPRNPIPYLNGKGAIGIVFIVGEDVIEGSDSQGENLRKNLYQAYCMFDLSWQPAPWI